MRKKPLLAFDELEHAHDLRAKLLGRRQLAADGGNFKAATASRGMQWGALTEGKQKNELAA